MQRMKHTCALVALFAALAMAWPAAQSAGPDVRLVLLVAVDQFRYDYLTRFRADYTGGLKRLLSDGAVFTDASLEHYPTVTAVGHATMLTGATPSVSGIIGNDWFDRKHGGVGHERLRPRGDPAGSAHRQRGIAAAAAREHVGRRDQDGLGPARGASRRAAGDRRLAQGSRGHPAGRPRRRRRLLVGHQDRQLRHQHVLHG